jgi:hypothetical protein
VASDTKKSLDVLDAEVYVFLACVRVIRVKGFRAQGFRILELRG